MKGDRYKVKDILLGKSNEDITVSADELRCGVLEVLLSQREVTKC